MFLEYLSNVLDLAQLAKCCRAKMIELRIEKVVDADEGQRRQIKHADRHELVIDFVQHVVATLELWLDGLIAQVSVVIWSL